MVISRCLLSNEDLDVVRKLHLRTKDLQDVFDRHYKARSERQRHGGVERKFRVAPMLRGVWTIFGQAPAEGARWWLIGVWEHFFRESTTAGAPQLLDPSLPGLGLPCSTFPQPVHRTRAGRKQRGFGAADQGSKQSLDRRLPRPGVDEAKGNVLSEFDDLMRSQLARSGVATSLRPHPGTPTPTIRSEAALQRRQLNRGVAGRKDRVVRTYTEEEIRELTPSEPEIKAILAGTANPDRPSPKHPGNDPAQRAGAPPPADAASAPRPDGADVAGSEEGGEELLSAEGRLSRFYDATDSHPLDFLEDYERLLCTDPERATAFAEMQTRDTFDRRLVIDWSRPDLGLDLLRIIDRVRERRRKGEAFRTGRCKNKYCRALLPFGLDQTIDYCSSACEKHANPKRKHRWVDEPPAPVSSASD